jgi:DNA-directed RNA polymerase subunit beta
VTGRWITSRPTGRELRHRPGERADGRQGQLHDRSGHCRCRGDFIDVEPDQGGLHGRLAEAARLVAASLIPFLEHDDANRALMGSNMQRQAVPLLVTEAPFVATGIEDRVARDSARGRSPRKRARWLRVTGSPRSSSPWTASCPRQEEDQARAFQGIWVYEIRKFMRSNAAPASTRRFSSQGQTGEEGPGAGRRSLHEKGELALGRNVLVAFMPWNGYNFEDAILINERSSRTTSSPRSTSRSSKCGARDTKLGPEEITRDIPNLGEEALKNLGPRRRHPRRRRGEAGRHPRRQDHARRAKPNSRRKSVCCAPSSVKRRRT